MKKLTLNDLFLAINDEIRKGNGDKVVLVADDDEGNGYHPIYFAVTPMDCFDLSSLSCCNLYGIAPADALKKCIVIG